MAITKPEQGTEEEAPKGQNILRPGPYRGRTCYVQRADRIKIKVELGFGISATEDFRLVNLEVPAKREVQDVVKACLVILIGGRNVVVSDVGEPRSGVRPARIYVRCRHVPEEYPVIMLGEKEWLDVGAYLAKHSAKGFDPEGAKKEILSWKDE